MSTTGEGPIFDSESRRDAQERTDAEWREYHERSCEEGDGWSHGFEAVEFVAWDSEKRARKRKANIDGRGQINFVHEPRREVVKHFTAENWSKMGDAMSCSPALKYVDLSECSLTPEHITALFGGERSYDECPLAKLSLMNNPLGPSGAAALLPFLKLRSKLVYLNLNGTNLEAEGARLLSEALNHVQIEYLHACKNSIGDEGIDQLLSAENSARIVELCITENVIGPRGYDAISCFLQRDDTELKKLLFNCDNGEYAKAIVNSISNKSKLEDIFLWGGDVGRGNEMMIAALPNMQNLLCNTSSFDSLCESNHQMKWLGKNTELILGSNSAVRKALDINARSRCGATRAKVVRCKLRNFYLQGEYDVHPFAEMNIKLMPDILELVTKAEVCHRENDGYLYFGTGTYEEVCSDNLDGVYRLVRKCHLPDLFCFASPELKS